MNSPHLAAETVPDPKSLVDLVHQKSPKLIYSYIKYLWYSGQRTECLPTLVALIDNLGSHQFPSLV